MSEGRLAPKIPVGWVVLPAADACIKIQDGTHFSPKTQLPKGQFPYITAKNVRSSGLDLSHITFLREEDHQVIFQRCDCRKGDVLLVKDGVNTGEVAVNTLDGEISLLSSVCMLRPHAGLLSAEFLRFYLQSPLGQSSLTGRMSGTAIRRIILRRIKQTPVLVCSVPEQRRIVEAIESYFTRLDDAVTTLARVQRNLKRYRASVLKAAVEGQLVPTEAQLARVEGRDYEPASELMERILAVRRRRWETSGGRGKYREPRIPNTSGLPKLPEGWCRATVEQTSLRVTVGHVGSMRSEYMKNGIPFLRSQNVRENRFDPAGLRFISSAFHARLRKSSLMPGDVLIVRSGAVGTSCVLPEHLSVANCSDVVIVQRPLVESQYIAFFMNSLAKKAVREQQVGIALTHFNTKSAGALVIPIPPQAEQKRIVAEVSRILSVVDQVERTVTAQIERSQRLRQSILKSAFEGKLADQDPKDEPASALLERIKAERNGTITARGRSSIVRARKTA